MGGIEGGAVLNLVTFDPSRGRTREVPLRFIAHEGNTYVLARRDPRPRWVSELEDNAQAHWWVGRSPSMGSFQVVTDEALIDGILIPLFEGKYGRERVRRWFGSQFLCLVLVPNGRTGLDYYSQVEALFDGLSGGYERTVEANPLDRYLREVSIPILRGMFHPGERVLEIGCGTGLETIPLAQSGAEVVAVDISGGMLERLRAKAASAGLEDRVLIRRLKAADLGEILEEFGPRHFHGAFSTFGAFNCEPELSGISSILGELVKPDGSLLLGVWNRVCLMEILLFGLGLSPRRALSRLRSPVPVGLSRFGVPVFPHTPEELLELFSPNFIPVELLGLPVLVPPYDLGQRLPSPDRLRPLVVSLDRSLRSHYPFNRLGDHFLLSMRRR